LSTKKDINVEIGANIRREREKVNLTQEQFSELIGIGPKSLSAIERGTVGISLTTLRKICLVLSISCDTIVFNEIPLNDVGDISEKLRRLTKEQFEITKNIIYKLIEAFALSN